MTTLPLGLGAYKRTYDGSPEIKLVNRFVERKPTNPVEKVALLARPGTDLLDYFTPDTNLGKIRNSFSQKGIFDSDLFVVSGKNLYRYDGSEKTQISGEVQTAGTPRATFLRGADYARMFITDGALFQYYGGGTAATGELTYAGEKADLVNVLISVNGVWYGWTDDDVDANSPDGTLDSPFLCLISTDPDVTGLESMQDMLNFVGTRGVNFSSSLTTANNNVSAEYDSDTGKLTLTSRDTTTASNDITINAYPVPAYLSWDGAHLSGGATGVGATGTLTFNGTDADLKNFLLNINGTWYGWTDDDVDANDPDGTRDAPYLCLIGTDALDDMADMLNFDGTAGTDFSTAITAQNPDVSAASSTDTLTLTARTTGLDGNDITVDVDVVDTYFGFDSSTLTGGGVEALHGISLPNGEAAIACASLKQYVLVACANSQRFYFLRPGEVEIDGLDFMSKESSPDNIVDLVRVGDVLVVIGSASIEFWSATGDPDTPFAPIEGRTMSLGAVDGSVVVVDQSTIILVGSDYRVYAISSGPQPISDNGIEERIRRQLQSEAS